MSYKITEILVSFRQSKEMRREGWSGKFKILEKSNRAT